MLSGLSQQARVAVLGVGGAVLAFFLFGGLSDGGRVRDPIDAVPRDSFLVATVNVAELRQSPLYEVLFGKEDGEHARARSVLDARVLGMDKLAEACGFDPLARVEHLAVGVPEGGEKGEIGVAARVTVSREELERCSANLAGERGEKVETSEVGSFVVVEDHGTRGPPRPHIAYGRGGLLVVARGAWFEAMLGAADGKKPSVKDAAAHAAVRSSLTSRDGWTYPTVLVSALLPKTLRDKLRAEMDGEVPHDGPGGAESIMAGVLGVASVGVALRAGTSSGTIDAAAELTCDSDDACTAVEKLLLKKRLEWSKELMLRMVGLGPLLDSLDVKRDGARIRVTAGAPARALATTLDRVLRFSSATRERPTPPGPTGMLRPAPPPSPASSGETIPAPRP